MTKPWDERILVTSSEYDMRQYRMTFTIQLSFNMSGLDVSWWDCRKAAAEIIRSTYRYEGQIHE